MIDAVFIIIILLLLCVQVIRLGSRVCVSLRYQYKFVCVCGRLDYFASTHRHCRYIRDA
jgi:hypothetical protein